LKTWEEVRVGFVGAGNMAEAIARGLLDRKLVGADRLIVSDPSADRRRYFAESLGIRATDDNAAVVSVSDVIILAVKPQVMGQATGPVAPAFRHDHLVISIAAGIRTEKLDAFCGGIPAVVRVMPNTPALVGRGVSALCAGPRAEAAHLDLAEKLFASVGTTLRVQENAMDAVTAISGSGPAYVFYWMEAMLKAAGELGFDAHAARQLVYETLSGAAALAVSSAESPEVLRARVTSKGGTTEAAIRSLDSDGVASALIKAVHAAANRSRELSRT
jgi:pyrroline-5-carboxylate reductase